METFTNKDIELRKKWKNENPDSYIINSLNIKSSTYHILHKSTCKALNYLSHNFSWQDNYLQYCGEYGYLLNWFEESHKMRPQECNACFGNTFEYPNFYDTTKTEIELKNIGDIVKYIVSGKPFWKFDSTSIAEDIKLFEVSELPKGDTMKNLIHAEAFIFELQFSNFVVQEPEEGKLEMFLFHLNEKIKRGEILIDNYLYNGMSVEQIITFLKELRP